MKRFASLFVFFLVINAYSQEVPSIGYNKFQLGVNFSSDVCFRTLNQNGGNAANGVINARNKLEITKFGYTTGLNFVYNLNKTIGFETGVQFSDKGYQIETYGLLYGESINWVDGFNSADEPIKIIYSFYHLEVPLKANFSFGKKKVRFIASVGIVTNLLIDKKAIEVFRYNNELSKANCSTSSASYNNSNISPMVSAGIDWKATPKINLKAEPTIRYGVLKIIDTPITEYLWNFGLNVGCYYSL